MFGRSVAVCVCVLFAVLAANALDRKKFIIGYNLPAGAAGGYHAMYSLSHGSDALHIIQRAFSDMKGNGTITFTPGSYEVSGPINLGTTYSLTILGAGSNATTLKLASYGLGTGLNATRPLAFIGAYDTFDLTISGIALDGNHMVAPHGISGFLCNFCSNVNLNDFRANNFDGNGINVTSPEFTNYGLHFRDVSAHLNKANGLVVEYSEEFSVTGGSFIGNGKDGTLVVSGGLFSISKSDYRDNGCGISTHGTKNGTISANRFQNNSKSGLCLTNDRFINVTSNKLHQGSCTSILSSSGIITHDNVCGNKKF